MINGKIHYKFSFSIAMLNYQRVNYQNKVVVTLVDQDGRSQSGDVRGDFSNWTEDPQRLWWDEQHVTSRSPTSLQKRWRVFLTSMSMMGPCLLYVLLWIGKFPQSLQVDPLPLWYIHTTWQNSGDHRFAVAGRVQLGSWATHVLHMARGELGLHLVEKWWGCYTLYVMSNQSESSLVFNTTTGALENGR